MGEKEKAKELIEKFYNKQVEILKYEDLEPKYEIENRIAKECALISMNEKIKYAKEFGDVTIQDVEKFERIKTEIENYQL